jgi:hypothetical protein
MVILKLCVQNVCKTTIPKYLYSEKYLCILIDFSVIDPFFFYMWVTLTSNIYRKYLSITRSAKLSIVVLDVSSGC